MRYRPNPFLPRAAFGLLLATAVTQALAGSDPEFGKTVRQNIEVQTVDMNPVYKGTLMEGGVGRRSVGAMNRYMIDQIRPLASSDLRSVVGQQGGTTKSGDPSDVKAPQ
jgi:hypothetical protein